MSMIDAFEAKTQLSSPLERVAAGEQITITRHGTPIARMKAFGQGQMPGGLDLRDLIAEGRR